jgi:hypothetical protein
MTNYAHGFKEGVLIRGIPITVTHPGKVFWVSNSTVQLDNQRSGSNGNDGTFNAPFSTLAYAISQCVADRGDIIFIKPGHAETISSATALALNVAGVAIVGLGLGTKRPTFTLDTATTATIGVSAANVSLKNVVISANFADIVSAFTLTTAKYFTLEDVDIVETAVNMNFLHVIDTNTTDNAADGLRVSNCFWHEPDAATLAFALVDGSQKNWEIVDNVMVTGNATANTAALFTIATGKDLTGVRVLRNQIQVTGNAASTAGILITTDGTAGTGIIAYNNIKHLDATTEILITATHTYGLFENRATAVANAQGYLLPAIDS